MRHLAFATTLLFIAVLSLAAPAAAQTDGYKTATRMGGPTRFDRPVRDLAAVRAMMMRPRARDGVTKVLEEAGLSSLVPQVLQILSAADPAVMKETQVPVGGTWQWMALRRGGRPGIVKMIRWGGKAALPAFEFTIDDLNRTYTFVLVQECANLTLVNDQPSLEAARRAAAAEAERAAAAAAQAERDRAAAAAAAAAAAQAERDRAAAAAAQAERDRAAAAAAQAERDRAAAAAAAAEAARQAAEAARLAELKRAKIDWFVSPLFGKERRVREEFNGGRCAPLFGFKFGPDVRITPNVRFAPSLGIASNTRDGNNSSLFAEGELRRELSKGFIGAGIGVWDFNHSDTVAPTLLLDFGLKLHQAANGNRLFFTTEARSFLDKTDDVPNNYQFWGGFRYIWR